MSQMTLGNPQNTTEWAGPKDDNWPLVASRAAGPNRLMAFAGKAGRAYQTHRNTDRGEGRHNHVSVLSPYLRHRMVDETEVLRQILDQHTPNEAFKFVQEVFGGPIGRDGWSTAACCGQHISANCPTV